MIGQQLRLHGRSLEMTATLVVACGRLLVVLGRVKSKKVLRLFEISSVGGDRILQILLVIIVIYRLLEVISR